MLAKEGLLDMVMVGHLYQPRFSDGDRLPASLSGRAIRALRSKDEIGFRGVVVSDDMDMGAVRKAYSLDLPLWPQGLGSISCFCATQMLPAAAVARAFWIKTFCNHWFFRRCRRLLAPRRGEG